MSDLLKAAHDAAELALRHGADEAKVAISRSRGIDIEWRDGQLERVQERTRRSLSAEIFVDGRYSASSTSDLRPEAMEAFFAEAVSMTRLLEPDPHRGLPDPSAYEGRADVDLELFDGGQSSVSSEARRLTAAQLEERVRALAPDLPIVSVASSVSDGASQSARIHTNGFEGVREGTSFSYSAMVTVLDDAGKRPMGWDYTYRRHQADLDPVEQLARRAGERARLQLGASRPATGKYTIVVENRAIPRLLGSFLSPLSGPALQQRRSLWEGRKGDRIASPLLTIYDDPHLIKGVGSSLWDGDGFATHRRPIIDEGVLCTYLIDQYYARKMGVDPTGGDTHNLDWTLGDKGVDALVSDVHEGIYLDRFLGGNSNQTTGELSMGCAGRMIRNGQLAEPITEGNLAANFGDLWQNLVAVGNDPDPNGASRCPTCVFEGVQISGS